jgi:hypothetical protein
MMKTGTVSGTRSTHDENEKHTDILSDGLRPVQRIRWKGKLKLSNTNDMHEIEGVELQASLNTGNNPMFP